MAHLPLNYLRYIKDPEKLMRNFCAVRLEHLNDDVDLTAFSSLGEFIQHLTVSHCTFTNPKSLRLIFGNLKLLKNLVISRVVIDSKDVPDTSPAHEITLKKLSLVQADHRLLKYLSGMQVIDLEIVDSTNRTDRRSIVKFLSRQKKLTSLTIENLSDNECALFEFDASHEFTFKLKKLSTLFSHIRDVEKFDANFNAFMRLHLNTLEKLKVEGLLSPRICRMVISSLRNIVELEINVGELPQESSFYDVLKPNHNLKVLKLNGTLKISNLSGFKGIVCHYPNIEIMSLADTDCFVPNDGFHLLSVKLKKLSSLSVLNLQETFSPDVTLPSLKSFSVRILNKIDQWKNFITLNESIELLKVGWIKRDQFTPEIISEITNLPGLRHLQFGGRFIACKRIHDVIKKDYKNLQTLELTVANYDEIKRMKFIFPSNRSLWMPECLYFDEGSDREPLND